MLPEYDEKSCLAIIKFLQNGGMKPKPISGVLSNLCIESKFRSNNLQNGYENKPPYFWTDEKYTAAVDNRTYTDFDADHAGYGLCQWTSSGRKAGLRNYIFGLNKSISDFYSQLEWMQIELISNKTVYETLMKSDCTVEEAARIFMVKFERPADKSEENQLKRVALAQEFYDKYFGSKPDPKPTYTNSPLACMTQISPYRTSPRNHKIDTITIHCYVAQVSVERGCAGFQKRPPGKEASCNYVIGTDGRIGLVVEEKDMSWCSNSNENDNRAITIECSSDNYAPYAINDAVMKSLINLCADICKRNDIKALKFSFDKNERMKHLNGVNMTCHRDYSTTGKSCPGDYIYEREPYIAEQVNKILNGDTPVPPQPFTPYKVRVSIPNLNIRTGPGTNYPTTGKYTGVGVFTIVEESAGKGSTKGWGKLKSGAGWIALDYATKI